MGQMGGGPDISSEREISAGGDFAAGLGPTHYGSGPLPLQADEDVVVESASSTAHTITFSNRGGGSVATGTRPLAAGGSLLIRGRGISAITIDSADSSVTWAKGAAGTVWPVNPSIAGGASSVPTTAFSEWMPSAALTMGGFGSTIAITPKKTGLVEVRFQADMVSTSSGDTMQMILKYGTGSAPAQGAAATGTTIAAHVAALGTASGSVPATLVAIVQLSVGVAYWFDFECDIGNAGADYYDHIYGDVKELAS